MFRLHLIAAVFVILQSPTLATAQHDSHENARRRALMEFNAARSQFGSAIEEFRKRFSSEETRKEPARQIEKKINTFLRYLRLVAHERPSFDPAELKKLSEAQLAAETLALAQRVRPELRRISRSENSAAVPIAYWQFLYKIEADLLRLKWMTSQLR
jgi:hypothetical protein